MKPRYGFLLMSAVLSLAAAACGGKEKPPLTPDMTEEPAFEGDAGAAEPGEPESEEAPAS